MKIRTADNHVLHVELIDDGTLDTVLTVEGVQYRFSDVEREPDGTITAEAWEYIVAEAIDAYLTDIGEK